MKKTILLSFAAIVAAMTSCNKVEQPIAGAEAQGETIQLVANTTIGDQTKITMGAKSGQVYPMAWADAECTYLRETIVLSDIKSIVTGGDSTKTNHFCSDSFSKTDAHSGNFKFTIDAFPGQKEYNYIAVYPCTQGNYKDKIIHGVRYSGDDSKNRVSYILNHTVNQVPAADGPDQTTHIYIAKDMGHATQPTELNLDFRPVVGYGKMTIKNFPALDADETATSIIITGPSDKKTEDNKTYYSRIMTGRVYKYFRETTGHQVGDVVPYDANNVKNYVKIDPKNITFNTAGFDVWFTTLPIKLTGQKDTISVSVVTNKSTYSFAKVIAKDLEFKEGCVSEFTFDYNKRIQDLKIVTFPFQSLTSVPAKWPTEGSKTTSWTSFDNCDSGLAVDNGGTATENAHRRMTANITVNKETYTFILADCDGAGSHAIYWNVTKGIQANAQRYFGLPVIEGMRIKKIEYTNGASNQKANYRKVGVVDNIVTQTSGTVSPNFIEGGKLIDNGPSGAGKTQYVFNVVNPLDNTGKTGKQIYMFTTAQTSIFRDMTITWEKVK